MKNNQVFMIIVAFLLGYFMCGRLVEGHKGCSGWNPFCVHCKDGTIQGKDCGSHGGQACGNDSDHGCEWDLGVDRTSG